MSRSDSKFSSFEESSLINYKKFIRYIFLWILEVAHRTEPNQIEVNQTKIYSKSFKLTFVTTRTIRFGFV